MTTRQVEVADERISRIKCATVMLPGSFPVTFGAPIAVTVTGVLVTVLGEPATSTTSERQVFVFTIVNAVFTLARIEITRIEIP